MNKIEKVKEVFNTNRIIAKQLGNPSIMSIIDGIEKEVLDVLVEVGE